MLSFSCWSPGCLREKAADKGQGLGLMGIARLSPLVHCAWLAEALRCSLLSEQMPEQGLTFHYLGKLGECQPREAWLCLPLQITWKVPTGLRPCFKFQFTQREIPFVLFLT